MGLFRELLSLNFEKKRNRRVRRLGGGFSLSLSLGLGSRAIVWKGSAGERARRGAGGRRRIGARGETCVWIENWGFAMKREWRKKRVQVRAG